MSSTVSIEDLCATDLSLICRGCLATSGKMKNMVEWGLTDEFYRLTNIQVNTLDNPSLLLCLQCEDILYKSRSFKVMCQTSDQMLKNAIEMKQSKESDWANIKSNSSISHDNIIHTELTNDCITIKITAPNMDQKLHLPCHYCPHQCLKKTDLMSHITKVHSMSQLLTIVTKYYCHIQYCAYHINSDKEKHFNSRKHLNQHILKVHGEKVNCLECNLSFHNDVSYKKHLKTCNITHICNVCGTQFNTNEKMLVHLMRKHPEHHRRYKDEKCRKRCSEKEIDSKRVKKEKTQDYDKEYFCDSPKRSFATQTLEHIKNDVTLSSWQTKKDEISTQTVFEDLLSLKSTMSEEETIFSDSVSLSDIQTQTLPLEFGLSRSNKETITSETQSPDLSIKETQTCVCLYDSKPNFRCIDSVSSSPSTFSILTSTETQTLDDFLSFSSAETQTCFDDKEL
ncbi:uncharacterized protein LOC112051223 [Bicyclus anynana]|uniref:Uncharacterized protein LOC112051223 n=1 Tax=Bicyclus anynana TaxID=110368 RepID=A0A6J1NCP1_BICAN|nr:uncharacterized protein LOC112051223 [Bicyclus anynana]